MIEERAMTTCGLGADLGDHVSTRYGEEGSNGATDRQKEQVDGEGNSGRCQTDENKSLQVQ
jgi:hypothetical protein